MYSLNILYSVFRCGAAEWGLWSGRDRSVGEGPQAAAAAAQKKTNEATEKTAAATQTTANEKTVARKKDIKEKNLSFQDLETIIDSCKKNTKKWKKNRLFRCLLNNFNAFWNHTSSFKLKYLRLYKRVNLFFPCTRIFFKLCKKAILVILKYKVSRSNLAICRYCTVHQR